MARCASTSRAPVSKRGCPTHPPTASKRHSRWSRETTSTVSRSVGSAKSRAQQKSLLRPPGLDAQGLGDTLGRPDYRYRTEEPNRTTAIYAKFMRDLSVNVCTQMTEHDQAACRSPRACRPVTVIFGGMCPSSALRRKKRSRPTCSTWCCGSVAIKANTDVFVTSLRAVFEAGRASTGLDVGAEIAQIEGWRGVCMALIESPMFHLD